MCAFTGVVSWFDILSEYPSLKREALMFNRLAVSHLKSILTTKSQFGRSSEQYVNELNGLIEKDIVFEAPEIPPDLGLFNNQHFLKNVDSTIEQQDKVNQLVAEIDALNPVDESRIEHLSVYLKMMKSVADSHIRATSIQLRVLNSLDAYPVVSTELEQAQESHANKSDVVQIILNALPVPDESTSWEQIFEYRSDPDSQAKFLDLRNWMNEVARGNLTSMEIEQKLEYLLSRYQRHLELHRMKTNAGTLETIVVMAGEIAENLAHFNFGKAAKALFSLKHRRIALMEGELTSPGSEVAYVIKARERFV